MKTCKSGYAVPGKRVTSLFALTGIILGFGSVATAQTGQTNLAVTVRHAPSLNGNLPIEEFLKEQAATFVLTIGIAVLSRLTDRQNLLYRKDVVRI